ncbi:BAHD acyltransferase DCR-like [Hibiscus syriacus]|uniref:BAHD acyltransferase DCR-like n=1 Tax=Hibiscus syriacus TaxID=106335 RepID=A0A6A3D265_HIBSY|nr:protein SRC2 homolog [Hibiscus syriacus]KAE8733908.1 BAHD acyltransferase DCR-like [Hibiscus syriacus]
MASPHEIEVTFSSARGLKNVNWRHGPIRPYVVVWVHPKYKCSTRADEEGDTDPTWDETIIIPLPGPIDEDTTLFVDVVHAGSEEGTKPLIGSARLKLREVLDDAGFGESYKRTLQLKRPSGRPQGKLDIKVLIRETRYRTSDQYQAHQYRVPPTAAPHPSAYGYPYALPPSGYPYYATPPGGYPYSAYNYNAPPPPYGQAPYGEGSGGYYYGQEGRKSKFGGMGTGMAVGAVAGALGGLALAEGVEALEDHIADEAAERVEDDLGYDVDVVGDDF